MLERHKKLVEGPNPKAPLSLEEAKKKARGQWKKIHGLRMAVGEETAKEMILDLGKFDSPTSG